MILLAQAVTTAGRKYELSLDPCNEPTARRLVTRAAVWLARIGNPATWTGAIVKVIDATDGRLVAVARVPTPKRDREEYGVASQAIGRDLR